MNIMGIRIFAKFPKYINMYNLRPQDRLKTNLYRVLISTLKQTSSEILLTGVILIYTQIPSERCSGQTSHS